MDFDGDCIAGDTISFFGSTLSVSAFWSLADIFRFSEVVAADQAGCSLSSFTYYCFLGTVLIVPSFVWFCILFGVVIFYDLQRLGLYLH